MNLNGLRIGLVGPLPPPEGGIANQTRQLGELLAKEGAQVVLVPVNAPYRPCWIGRVRGMRALFRLVPYVVNLWRAASRVDLFHVMANSGWSWHLFAAPAVWVARLRGVPCVVNYRGGHAADFLQRSSRVVSWTLRKSSLLVVPSGFLKEIFGRYKLSATVVPNVVDLNRFYPATELALSDRHLVVARNLDPIYDVGTALRAFRLVLDKFPDARMTVAGDGPERAGLVRLAHELRVSGAVTFAGRLDRAAMAELYRSAAVVLNPSLVDNMPNSVLEALASGVPVVSTNVGGVPFIVRKDLTALLISPGDASAMAGLAIRILSEPGLAQRLRGAGLADVQQYAWRQVKVRWEKAYAMSAPSIPGAGVRGRTA